MSTDPIVPLPPPGRRDTGLGTAYERWAIYELLREWFRELPVGTALEGPIDGMAGIPGLHLLPAAEKGWKVTVLVPNEDIASIVAGIYAHVGLRERLDVRASTAWPSESFDLVLTYNALPSMPDWRAYLAEAAAHARRYLIVSVTHPSSYGVFIRKVLRLIQPGPKPMELFDHPSGKPKNLLPELARFGKVVAQKYVDCPWWPDLFVDPGQSLVSGTLGRLPGGSGFKKPPSAVLADDPVRDQTEPFLYGPTRFPFLGGPGWKEELEPAVKRHPNLDGSRHQGLAGMLAHHCMRLVEKA